MNFFSKKIVILIILIFLAIIIVFLFFRLNLFQSIFRPRAGSCLVLEEKYCKNVKLIPNPNNPTSKIAVFDLPIGTPIFAPTDGYYSNTPTFFHKIQNTDEYKTYPGSTITVSKNNTVKTVEAVYNLVYFVEKESVTTERIKKGDVIGTISDKKIDYLGNYNLVFSATDQKIENGRVKYLPKDLNALLNINE